MLFVETFVSNVRKFVLHVKEYLHTMINFLFLAVFERETIFQPHRLIFLVRIVS